MTKIGLTPKKKLYLCRKGLGAQGGGV